MSTKKKGIILMNLGSPDSTEVSDVRKYLNEFLTDKRVIDSWPVRHLLVRTVIVPSRAPNSAEAYRTIWTKEGSPLVNITRELAEQLQARIDEPVVIAMRYGNPGIAVAFDNLLKINPDLEEVLSIPLYPHYAMSSYETAVENAKEIHRKKKYRFKLGFLPPFYQDPKYIHAMAENIRPHLANGFDHLLFSFHGIPERHLIKSDPTHQHCLQSADCCTTDSVAHDTCYRYQCLQTMKRVVAELGIPGEKCSFSFQSRLLKDPWLKPYTDFRLQDMPKEGIKKLLVTCPSFVSDCLETLEEIAIRGRETFLEAGGEDFAMIPCLNTHPLWVQSLADWISQ